MNSARDTGDVQQHAARIAVANTGVVGGNLIVTTTTTEEFWTEAFPHQAQGTVDPRRLGPSGLLAAGSRVVDFIGRATELTRLTDWRDQPGELSVLLVHAPGGQGKTRLAAAFAEQSAGDGWAVAQARHDSDPRPAAPEVSRTAEASGLLVVVDYAERWPRRDLERLLQSAFLRQGGRARVLLLARPADYWWKSLANPVHKLGGDVHEIALGPLADEVADRRIVFDQARDRFAVVLGAADVTGLRPAGSLADDAYELVLTLHMSALVAVDAHVRGTAAPTDPAGLSAYLLGREYDHWETMAANGRISVPPKVMGRLVGLATLTRPLRTATAAELVAAVHLATGPADAYALLDGHATCYPPSTPGTALEPLFPDRLGEDFLGTLLPDRQQSPGASGLTDGWAADLPARLLASGTEQPHVSAALAVLVETGRRWEHVRRDYLFPLLHENPRLIMDAGGASLVALTDYADPALLERLDAHLPDRHRHVDLDTGMAALTRRLTDYGVATTTDDATLGPLYVKLASRASHAGLLDEAVAADEQAVTVYRRLAQARPAAYEGDLATALNNLSASLAGSGRNREALPPSQEAVELRRRLAATAPSAYLPDLAASLNNLGAVRAHLGSDQEALVATREAVALYRELPPAHLSDLAKALNNLGRDLAKLGRFAEALEIRQESVEIRRRLAESHPSAHLPGLAASLHSLGRDLSRVKRDEEAHRATEEAAEIRRRLAEAAPAAHEADLAASLSDLGARLMRLGRNEDALVVLHEAVEVERRLAELNAAAHLPGLAASLHRVSVCLHEMGDDREALAVCTEAVEVRRRLVATAPAAYEPDFARSLRGLGVYHQRLRQYDEALAVTQEAVAVYRRLAETGVAHLVGLARAVRDTGLHLVQLDRVPEALRAHRETVEIGRRLRRGGFAGAEPLLAKSLRLLASVLPEDSEKENALRESVEIHRRLAATGGQMNDRDFAWALADFADCLATLGRPEEELVVRGETVEVWRRLPDQTVLVRRTTGRSLGRKAALLSSVDRDEEAVAAAEEEVEVWRGLAAHDPVAFEPNLARSLSFRAIRLSWLGRHDEALTANQEAVEIRRRLAAADPATYRTALARSLHFLGIDLMNLDRPAEALPLVREAVEHAGADQQQEYRATLTEILDALG